MSESVDMEVLHTERDRILNRCSDINAMIDELEGERAILGQELIETNNQIAELKKEEEQEKKESKKRMELLKCRDSTRLNHEYRKLNRIIDTNRKEKHTSSLLVLLQRKEILERIQEVENDQYKLVMKEE